MGSLMWQQRGGKGQNWLGIILLDILSRKLISRTLCSDFSLAVAPFLCYQSSSFGTVAECGIKTGIYSSNGLATKSNNKKSRMKSKVDFTKIDPSLLPTVIIVGRPNVGKSALFNRLIRRREVLVYNTPDDHVTRDIREVIAKLGDLRFKVLDSAGLETEATSGTILSRTIEMTGMVLARTQLAILLIDVRDGLQPLDLEVGKWMRKHASKVHTIVAMNKSESLDERGLVAAAAGEAHSLGFGDPIAISAETGLGMAEMYETLRPLLEDYALQLPNDIKCKDYDSTEVVENLESKVPLQLAIMGRPNVGKSTLLNNLLQEERVLVGPESGLTRDSIRANSQFEDRTIYLEAPNCMPSSGGSHKVSDRRVELRGKPA